MSPLGCHGTGINSTARAPSNASVKGGNGIFRLYTDKFPLRHIELFHGYCTTWRFGFIKEPSTYHHHHHHHHHHAYIKCIGREGGGGERERDGDGDMHI